MHELHIIATRFLTLGFALYLIGGGLVITSIAIVFKGDMVGALVCSAIGIIFVATGMVQIHEERYHKKPIG